MSNNPDRDRNNGPNNNMNYPTTPGTAYQQTYGGQQPQQAGYFGQQPFINAPFNNPQQYQQQQQYGQQQFQPQQQQLYHQQQQANVGYDANGLAQQLQNQHLNARQNNPPGSPQGQRPRTAGSLQASGSLKDDYVVFPRDDSGFSSSTRERAKALKVKVELHYNQSVGYAVERNQR